MLTKSKFLELHRRQQQSGLTVKEFCYNEAVAPSTFYYWKKKLRQKSNPDFIPLVVNPTQAFHNQHQANQRSVPQSEEADALLELVYPNGTRLRFRQDIALTQLRSLICLFD